MSAVEPMSPFSPNKDITPTRFIMKLGTFDPTLPFPTLRLEDQLRIWGCPTFDLRYLYVQPLSKQVTTIVICGLTPDIPDKTIDLTCFTGVS